MIPSITYNFIRFNANNGGKWSEGTLPPHANFLSCSEIAVCLETVYSKKVSDRAFSLSGEWEIALADERSEIFDSLKATFVPAQVPDKTPAFSLFGEGGTDGKCFLYRKEFDVFNPSYDNTLVFERVGGAFEVYLNGKFIGASRLGSGEFDIKDAQEKGTNVLLVRVASDDAALKTDVSREENEGIFGDVILKVRKDAYLNDYTFVSKRNGIDMEGKLTLYAKANDGVKACAVLADGEEIVSEQEVVFENGVAEMAFSGDFAVYSAENPYLYDLYIRIVDGEEEKECSMAKIGFAPAGTDGDAFTLDGTPITLKGAVYYPDAFGDYRDELGIMKSFNMNAVWLKGVSIPDFYEACAEIGLYVINEIPFVREKVHKEKVSKHGAVNNADEYMKQASETLAKLTAAYPNVIAYAFGNMTDEEQGKETANLIAEKYGKPVANVGFGAVPFYEGMRPFVAFIPADKITADGAEALLGDEECSGVFADAYRGKYGEKGLFDENNVETENAVIAKYVFRPYISFLADSRTLTITNTKAFAGSDGLTVTVSSVKDGKEEIIQKITPVIAAGHTRDYGIYLGEYDESTKIRVRYDEKGAHLATETLSPKIEEELPEYKELLKGESYEYTVANVNFGLGKTEENVLPARSAFVPCSSETVCNAGDNETGSGASDRLFTLSGEWDFAYFADNAPSKFGGNGMKWDKIKLPSSWESAGFEKFAYSYGYPFEVNIKKCEIKEDKKNKNGTNSTGIYRKFINVADAECRHILSFGKVNGSLELQINGKYVGFSMTGSAEFDVSEFLKLGENEIVVIVKKSTPAAMLYGADGFRATGIIGDVNLIKVKKSSLFDYDFKVIKEGNVYTAGLALRFFTDDPGKCKVELKKDGETVYETVCEKDGDKVYIEIKGEFASYNEETKETYDLFIKTIEKNFVAECTKVSVGFNEVSIIGDTMYYNGEPLKIRGIAYNPVYNAAGEPMGIADIKRDLALIKAYGFNAVMPSGYVLPEFVAIAKKAGLYVIGNSGIDTSAAAANGAKYRDAVMNEKAFESLAVKTVFNAYSRDKNECNVIAYFLAENGTAANAAKCVTELKKNTAKPVFCFGNGDVMTADFPAVNDVVDMINEAAGRKPLFLARYALSTGIGCATMNAYEDLISSTPCCAGGCVAYFADDVIKGEGRKACGIFTAERQPYAGAEFIKYLYRPVRSEITDGATAIELTNTRKYRSTDDLTVRLNVVVDGKTVSGTVLDVRVQPGETKKYDIFVGHIEGDMFLDVEYYSKETEKLLYVEQHELSNTMKVIAPEKGVNPLICTELFDYLDIEFDCGSVRFNKRLGSIARYVLRGKELLKYDSVRKGGNSFVNNIRRPFIRNMNGKTPVVTSKVRDFECDYKKEGTFGCVHVNIENVLFLDGKESYIVQDKYIVNASGAIEVFSVLTPLRRGLPVMDCFGKQIRFGNAFGNVLYYGNGEGDNYIDMCEHTRVGIFGLNVDKTFENMPVLQECGNRTNVRFAVIKDNDGDGVVISAKKVPLQLRVSPYSDKQIAEAFVTNEKPAQSGVYVDVNAFVSGIGTSENGYPLPHYVICSGEHVLHFDFIPLSAK